MPYCGDCRNYYPYVPDEDDRAYLIAAYHDHDCGVRMMLDFDGMLMKYTFEGDVMWEEQEDGTKKPISTFSGFPAPYVVPDIVHTAKEKAVTTKPVPSHRVWSWEEWSAKFPNWAGMVKKDLAGYWHYFNTPYDHHHNRNRESDWGGHTTYTYSRPFDNIDKERWPNLWKFYVKFHFLPGTHKETKFVNGVEPLPAKGTPKTPAPAQ